MKVVSSFFALFQSLTEGDAGLSNGVDVDVFLKRQVGNCEPLFNFEVDASSYIVHLWWCLGGVFSRDESV